MRDLQAIADRLEIEALQVEFTDALMMHVYDRFAALLTDDGVWRIPYINVEIVSRAEIRKGMLSVADDTTQSGDPEAI